MAAWMERIKVVAKGALTEDMKDTWMVERKAGTKVVATVVKLAEKMAASKDDKMAVYSVSLRERLLVVY
jgi:hypothetical protein